MSYQYQPNDLVVGQNIQNIHAESFLKSLYCGQQQTSGQLLYPGYQLLQTSSLVHPASNIPHLLQRQQVPTTTTLTPTKISSPQPQQKKFRPPQKSQKYIPKPIPLELGNLKTYSNPDILICGNCRELFDDLVDMLDHKKNYCKMRFTCKCEDMDEAGSFQDFKPLRGCDEKNLNGKTVCLKCSHCKETFTGAWDLIFHVQNAHCINIYTLGENDKKTVTENTPTPTPTSKLQNIQDHPKMDMCNPTVSNKSSPVSETLYEHSQSYHIGYEAV